jgi:hypothetical protein
MYHSKMQVFFEGQLKYETVRHSQNGILLENTKVVTGWGFQAFCTTQVMLWENLPGVVIPQFVHRQSVTYHVGTVPSMSHATHEPETEMTIT